jgi:hypothetical protein
MEWRWHKELLVGNLSDKNPPDKMRVMRKGNNTKAEQ